MEGYINVWKMTPVQAASQLRLMYPDDNIAILDTKVPLEFSSESTLIHIRHGIRSDRIDTISYVPMSRDPNLLLKAHQIFCVATIHQVKHLVLSPWGCEKFENDPWDIASIFLRLINDYFLGTFDTIIFAMTDEKLYRLFDEALK
jgi:hypothetical protein